MSLGSLGVLVFFTIEVLGMPLRRVKSSVREEIPTSSMPETS